jgi:hypothetical protein
MSRLRPCLALLLGGAVLCTAPSSLLAGVNQQDLGDGLQYLRIAHTPSDLPRKEPHADGLCARIIDLRATNGDRIGVETLIAWLQFQAKSEVPTLVLLNRQTPAPLARYILSNQLPSLLSFSASPCQLGTDITVDTSLEADLGAVESIDQGNAVAGLISSSVQKERYDEAQIASEHAAGTYHREAEPTTSERTDKAAQPSREADPVLARAVQVQRALAALHPRKKG